MGTANDGRPGSTPDTAGTLPVTTAQAGIWFAQRLDPDNPIYTTGERVDLHGPLDVEAFAHAVGIAVDEADALHVRVVEVDGEPRQRPLTGPERPAWQLERVDVCDEPDPDAAALAWMRAALARPVDPATADAVPLFGHALLRLGDEHHVWFHRYHHLVTDAYGFSLIARRVAAVSVALAAGEEVPARRFGSLTDLVAGQREAAAASHDADREFFAGRFPGAPEPARSAPARR